MEIIIEPELQAYLKGKKQHNIVVDVATANTSDIEISEIFLRTVTDSNAAYLKEKKKFRGYPVSCGEVLLPNYRLEISDTVVFRLKKVLFFHRIEQEGIRL